MNKFQSDWRGAKCFYCKKKPIGDKHSCLCNECYMKITASGEPGKILTHPLWNIRVWVSVD